MKKTILYSSLILVLGAIACNKTDEIVPKSDALISIRTGIDTKSFIGTQELLQANATLHIMDFVGTEKYIDDNITYVAATTEDEEGAWDFVEGHSYTWKSGDHKFYGWLVKDGNLTVSPTYTQASHSLSYSKALTTAAADQADFLYSNVIKRNPSAAGGKAAVPLQFIHLFSGIRISLTNSLGKQITVKSVSISGLKNSATGNITFGDPTETNAKGTSVSIDNLAESGSFISATALTNQALADGGKIDVLSQSVLGADATAAAYMIWPQLMDGTAKVTVVYNTGETDAADKTRVVDLAIPDGNGFKTMAAAYRYSFDLNIVSNDIQLTFVVADWDAKPTTITSGGGANITMSNVMWLHNRQVFYESAPSEADAIIDTEKDPVTGQTTVYGSATIFRSTAEGHPYVPVRAYFSIDYPTAGTYQIKLVRAYGATNDNDLQYFTLDNTGDTIVPGKEIYFSITASDAAKADTAAAKAEHKCQVDITITPTGGQPLSAYSEIRATYTVIIPARTN